jgi:hypothetical protein
MVVPFLNNFFWELLSILSLTMFGVFWLFDKISVSKYPMVRLLAMFFVSIAALVIWARVEVVLPPYWVGAFVDLILAAAMTMVGVNFILLILSACSLYIPRYIEKWIFIIVLIGFALYGFILFAYAPIVKFVHLDLLVNYWIRPFWIVVILTLLARIKVKG